MRQFFSLLGFPLFVGCASHPATIDPQAYSLTDMSQIVSEHFVGEMSGVERALAPSFEKFGQPRLYVTGKMSAVHESDETKLYGSGQSKSRFNLRRDIFWQIGGSALGQEVSPVQTVHLVYDKSSLDEALFTRQQMEVRRGQTYTVFERELDNRVVVSLFPTRDLPEDASFDSLEFNEN
jgi:hypothetical protein